MKCSSTGSRDQAPISLVGMIVPLLIEQLLQLVVGIADTMMVSYAGEATVSGVSLDTMIYTIFIYLFTFISRTRLRALGGRTNIFA